MIHVLVTYTEVVVKRVVNYIRTEKMLELRSDNNAVQPYYLPVEELREAWVVRLRITSNLSKPDGHEILDKFRQTVDSLADLLPGSIGMKV
jgi:hypothetical protein